MPILPVLFVALLATSATVGAQERAVSSLGRLEPKDGVIELAGPSGGSPVIKTLSVEVGDWVEAGQEVARLDSFALRKAEMERLKAVLANAQSEMGRQNNLARTSNTSRVMLDQATMNLDIAKADLAGARARLDLSVVKSPIKAQVLEIHARPGERVGPAGIMELGKTDQMFAVAEVYETDIALVAVGQKASVTLAALDEPLTGTVNEVGLKVGRLDVLGTDPIAKTDARVVEVRILLDDPASVSGLTNMQVEVEIAL